jgi:hypothetical protein
MKSCCPFVVLVLSGETAKIAFFVIVEEELKHLIRLHMTAMS